MEENKKVIEENITDQEALKKYQKEIESGKYQLEFVESGTNGDATYDDGPVTLVNVIEIEREELSPEARKRVEELIKNIDEWQKELDTIWKDKNTDAAEMERRNLRQLIDNAEREIKSIKGIVEEKEPLPDPKKYLENLKEIEKKKEETIKSVKKEIGDIDIQINRIGFQIEKLKEEKEMYGSRKNSSYVSISEEYDKKIESLEEEKKKLEEEKAKVQKKLKEVEEQKIEEDRIKAYQVLKKGIQDVEAEIDIIKERVHEKYKEINLAIKEGQKTPNGIPMVLELYKDLDKLREELKAKENEKREYEEWLEKIDGKQNTEKLNLNNEQQSEFIRFFHGQGDIVENVQRNENGNVIGNTNRDDRRGNDEYFGFEQVEDNRKDNNGRNNGDDGDGRNNGNDGDGRNNGDDGDGRNNGDDGDGRNNGDDGDGRNNGDDGDGRNNGNDGDRTTSPIETKEQALIKRMNELPNNSGCKITIGKKAILEYKDDIGIWRKVKLPFNVKEDCNTPDALLNGLYEAIKTNDSRLPGNMASLILDRLELKLELLENNMKYIRNDSKISFDYQKLPKQAIRTAQELEEAGMAIHPEKSDKPKGLWNKIKGIFSRKEEPKGLSEGQGNDKQTALLGEQAYGKSASKTFREGQKDENASKAVQELAGEATELEAKSIKTTEDLINEGNEPGE